MFCNHCGSEIEKNSNYCSQCGISVVVVKNASFAGEINQFCNACGIAASGNYCSACGCSCEAVKSETVKSETVKSEAIKKTLTTFNQKAQKHTENLNKGVVNKAIVWCQNRGTIIKERLSDKKTIKAYGMASIAALMSTYVLALILFLIIKQIPVLKDGYQSFEAFKKMLPNFMDLAHFSWQSVFRGKVAIQGSDGFAVTILSSVHSVTLFLIPIVSVWIGQKMLKKNMTAKFIDIGIVSVIFTLLFHMISIANQHSMHQDVFFSTVKVSYGVLLFRNMIGVGIIFFVLSSIMNYQQLMQLKSNRQHETLEKIKEQIVLGMKASLQIIIFGSAVTFLIILISSIALKVELKLIAVLLFVVWPNIALNSINLLLGGSAAFMSDGNSSQLISLLDVLKS